MQKLFQETIRNAQFLQKINNSRSIIGINQKIT